MNILNPSKGVDCYVFIAKKNQKVVYEVPNDFGFNISSKSYFYIDGVSMQTNHIEIDKSDIDLLKLSGRLEWNVFDNDKLLANKHIDINTVTGNTGSTNIESTLQENSTVDVDGNYAISYGFYDASSSNISELTDHDQSYVYITQNLSNWMGNLVASNSNYEDCPFNTFALAGSHDAGMYNNKEANKLVDNFEYTQFAASLADDKIDDYKYLNQDDKDSIEAIVEVAQMLIAKDGKNIIVNLAMTQKDDITMQLDLGIRYLDIRPGFCAYADSFKMPNSAKDAVGVNNLYHQHKIVPGISFDNILTEALNWLAKNKTEIIVMNLNFQGFFLESMKPTPDFIEDYLDLVASGLNISIKSGGVDDLKSSYQKLIKDNRRLIFLNQIGEQEDASKFDSYTDKYKTTDVDVIISQLEIMKNSSAESNYDYTVLQLQGTANGIISAIADSSATFSKKTSPLMSTKAMFDTKTYTWIYENVVENFETNQLMIFLNDFSDNALANQSKEISQMRMDKFLAKKG